MTATITPVRPSTRPARPTPRPPAAAKCGMCNGEGGRWTTNDGGTPGKDIGRWVPCAGCNGTGAR
jgi:DnaJ-class molecular chaperone